MDARSEKNLQGVKPALVNITRRAAEIVAEKKDGLGFIVTEGLRTKARQVQLVQAGASQTMNSRHLLGEAVDLAATVAGKVRWDWPLYAKLAEAMKLASAEQGAVLTWGAVWDTPLSQLEGELDEAAADYVARRKALGRKAFIDGPHFQIETDKAQT